jgi:hypothetical protein
MAYRRVSLAIGAMYFSMLYTFAMRYANMLLVFCLGIVTFVMCD